MILHADHTHEHFPSIRARRKRLLWTAFALRLIAALAAGVALPGQEAIAQASGSVPEGAPTTIAAVDSGPQLPEIVVQGHYDNAVGSSDAASQGTVNGALLQDIPLLRPGEVLETVPGLVVTQHSGDGKANQYFLRGYNLDHGTDFSSSIDGVPVNMPTNAHGQGYSDLNYLIPELVDRIDYFKGPYFANAGDFSAAGSANIRYRSSLDHGLAAVTVGDNGYRRVLMAGSAPVAPATAAAPGNSGQWLPGGGLTLLGALELQNDNGPWTLPEDFHKVNGLLRLTDGNVARGWSLDAAYYDANWNSTDQVPLTLIQSGQLCRYCALDPTDGGDTGREILAGEWHSNGEQSYSRISAYAQRYRLQLFSNFTYFELRPTTGDQFEQKEHRDFFGGQLVQGWNHGLFNHDSITEVGLALRHDNIHVGLFNSEARVPFETVSDDVVGETEAGAYVQNTTSWTPWLRSLAGIREQTISMNLTALAISQNSGAAVGSKALPKLSLILGPWAQTEFFVNWGRGFHSNDARGVIDKIDSTTGGAASPVPALVGATGQEIGVRTEAIPGLQSSLALWSLDSESELIYSADSGIGSTSPNGASKRYGIEWNNHLVAGRYLLFDADLAWTHARYAVNNDNGQSGDLIPNAVSKVAQVRATMQRLGPWSADVETRYIGAYPLSQDGTLTTPSAIVTNLRVQRTLSHALDLSLDVLNVFNREYFDIAYEQDYRVSASSPAIPNGVTVHPGEPREFRVTLKYRF
jgi:hypothetical protein